MLTNNDGAVRPGLFLFSAISPSSQSLRYRVMMMIIIITICPIIGQPALWFAGYTSTDRPMGVWSGDWSVSTKKEDRKMVRPVSSLGGSVGVKPICVSVSVSVSMVRPCNRESLCADEPGSRPLCERCSLACGILRAFSLSSSRPFKKNTCWTVL